MWVYFFFRCPDPRIRDLKKMIKEDESLNHNHVNVFHHAFIVYSRTKTIHYPNNSVIGEWLRNRSVSVLHSAEILFKVDTKSVNLQF